MNSHACDRVLTSCDLRQEKNLVDYCDIGCLNMDSEHDRPPSRKPPM